MDIRNPKIADYATKGDGVTNNKNIAKSIVVSFVMATLTGVLGLFFLLDGYVYGWVRLLVLAIGFMAVRIYLLRNNIKAYFDDIQG